MKKWLAVLALIKMFSVSAQTESDWQAIDRQVWIPYVKAYNSFDTRGFMALHTEDVIRVNREQGVILTGTEYRKNEYRRNSISQSRELERSLEIHFLDRVMGQAVAYEVGYYRVVFKSADGTEQKYFGLFHVTLRKVNDAWKIYIDADEVLADLNDADFDAVKKIGVIR